MSEMVEKVGAALRAECLAVFGSNWDNDTAWRFARAAIKAMREPTDAMMGAARRQNQLAELHVLSLGREPEQAAFAWRAMLDTALE